MYPSGSSGCCCSTSETQCWTRMRTPTRPCTWPAPTGTWAWPRSWWRQMLTWSQGQGTPSSSGWGGMINYTLALLVPCGLCHHCIISPRNVILWTPMDCAAAGGHHKLIQLLIDAEATLDPQDKSKVSTALKAVANFVGKHSVLQFPPPRR